MRGARFVIYEDKAGEWRWQLLAGNGKIIADSGEGYSSRTGVKRAAWRAADLAALATWGAE